MTEAEEPIEPVGEVCVNFPSVNVAPLLYATVLDRVIAMSQQPITKPASAVIDFTSPVVKELLMEALLAYPIMPPTEFFPTISP